MSEFFLGETEEEAGRIVRGYRLVNGQYQEISPEDGGYFFEVAGHFLPITWQL